MNTDSLNTYLLNYKYQNKAFVGKHRQMIFLMQHIRTRYKVSSDAKYQDIESTKVKNQMSQPPLTIKVPFEV